MFAITRFWNALAALTSSLHDLAGTVHEVNGQLRQRLQLDLDTPGQQAIDQTELLALEDTTTIPAGNGMEPKRPARPRQRK
jgi:hypothetical protein